MSAIWLLFRGLESLCNAVIVFRVVVALFSQLRHLKDKDVTLLVIVCSSAVCVLDLHCFSLVTGNASHWEV